MERQIFRAYDIRGIVGQQLQLEHVSDLACAIAAYFLSRNPGIKTVVVARDGRVHSAEIEEALCRALAASGLDVLRLGLCPTPVMYFALHTLPVQAGIMVTASHNGPAYNGLKINLGTHSVWGSELQEIYALYQAKACVKASRQGTMIDYPLIDRYIEWLVAHFPSLRGSALPMVIDCGNGATGAVLPQLVAAFGFTKAQLLYADIDGNFPNHEADPVVEKNMHALKHAVISGHAKLGIGFDGDGDRMAPLTASGRLVVGDELLLLYAQELAAGETVLYDIKCSRVLMHELEKQGLKPRASRTGHAIIKSALRETGAALAGELSCHFFFADRYFGYDDGIYAFLRLLELLHKRKTTLDELVATLPVTYTTAEIRLACAEEQKALLVERASTYFLHKQAQLSHFDGVQAIFGSACVLVRPSHTQSVICIRAEAQSEEQLHEAKLDVYTALAAHVDAQALKTELGL